MALPTLMDVIKSNAANGNGIGMIDEVSRRTPFMRNASFRSIKGVNFRTLVQTGASNTTGSFRKMNSGVSPASTNEENRLVETFPIQPRFHVDAQLADNSEDGAQAFMARKISGVLAQEFIAHEKQMFYGAASGLANNLGYPGLLDCYDSTNMVYDAGGTTANTGSSVWLVRFGANSVQGVLANGGQFQFGPMQLLPMPDPNDSTKFLDMYVQSLRAQVGLQVANQLNVMRIKKLTADVGHTLTDAILMTALTYFRQAGGPNAIFMSLRSLGQLRNSRTATNPSGTEAPFPTSIMGLDEGPIPIYPTAGILDTEPLTL